MKSALRYIALFIFLLLLAVGVGLWALSYPSVQSKALQRTAEWLSVKTGANIDAKSLEIIWPNHVFLGKVKIDDPSGRSFVYSDSLRAELDLWSLLKSDIKISELSLYGTRVFLEKTDSAWNYDFFKKAFPSSDTSSSSGKPMLFVKNTPLSLHNCQFTYHDLTKNIAIDTYLGDVVGHLDSIDLDRNAWKIHQITASNAWFDYKNTANHLSTQAGSLDYNHLHFDSLKLQASQFLYQTDSLQFQLEQASAIEKNSTLSFTSLQSKVTYVAAKLWLSALLAEVNQSSFMGDFYMDLDVPKALNLVVSSENTYVENADLTRLIGRNMHFPHALSFSGQVNGTAGDLTFEKSNITLGPNQFSVQGTLLEVQDSKRFGFKNFSIANGHVLAKDIFVFQPDLQLQRYLDSSAVLDLKGVLNGSLQTLQAQVSGKIEEKFKKVAVFDLDLATKQLLEAQRGLDFSLKSIWAEGVWATKFLPKNSLPEGKSLPDSLLATGHFFYDADSLNVEVQSKFWRNTKNSSANLAGVYQNFSDSSKTPLLDFKLTNGIFSEAELLHWLPETADYVHTDILERSTVQAVAKGSSKDMVAEVNFALPENSTVAANGIYKNGKLDLNWTVQKANLHTLLLDTFLRKIQIQESGKISATGTFSLSDNKKFNIKADFSEAIRLAEINFDSLQMSSSGQIDPVLSLENGRFSAFCAGKIQDINWSSKVQAYLPFLQVDTTEVLPNLDLLADLSAIRFQKDTIIQTPAPLRLKLHADKSEQDELILNSDWLQIEATGELDPLRVLETIDEALADNFDLNLGKNLDKTLDKAQKNTDFKIGLYRPEFWTSGLIEGLNKMDSLVLIGRIEPAYNVLQLRGVLPRLAYQNIDVSKGDMKLFANKKNTLVAATFASMDVNNKPLLGFSGITGKAENQVLKLKTFTTDDNGDDKFAVNLQVSSMQDSLELKFDTEQVLAYQKWQTNLENRILISLKDSDIGFDQVVFSKKDQQLSLQGSLQEGLNISTNKLEINPFLQLISETFPDYYGSSTINADLIQKASGIQWNASGKVEKLRDETSIFGDLAFKTSSAADGNGLVWDATMRQEKGQLRTVGQLDSLSFAKGSLRLDSFDLALARPFLKDYLSEYEGLATGTASFSGILPNIKGKGTIKVHSLAMKPTITKVLYTAKDQNIVLDSLGLLFSPFVLKDDKGRTATLAGRFTNEGQLDMRINAKDLKLLNTNKSDSSFYYGKIIANLDGKLTGPATKPTVSLQLRPTEESKLNYLYDDGIGALDLGTDVVYFENMEAEKPELIVNESIAIPYDVDVLLDVNDQLMIRAVVDKLTGDYFEGHTEGQLLYRNKASGQMYVNGTLNITDGTYRYTYNPLIKRKLEVVSGSTIQFTGDPFEPTLDMTARYRVKAALAPLLSATSSSTGSSNRETFYVDITIKGSIEKPDLSFAISYPSRSTDASVSNSDNAEVQSAITTINSDPAQLTQQVSSLLVLNSFVGIGTEFRVVDVASEVQNFVTSRLNSLTKNIKFVDIQFGSDENAVTDNSDYTVTLQKKLLDGRLILSVEGALGIAIDPSASSQAGSQSSLREISAEYLLTKGKQFRIRAFSKQQTIFILKNNEQLSNGLGLFFKKEFGGY